MTQAAQKICNSKMNIELFDRRPGDVDVLIADSSKIKKVLGWKPKYSNLDYILKTAWMWENRFILGNQVLHAQHFEAK
jgi:UDP-glucose 4-epimerase